MKQTEKLTQRQIILAQKHGTLREFTLATLNAIGTISIAEAKAAINKYEIEWNIAGERK